MLKYFNLRVCHVSPTYAASDYYVCFSALVLSECLGLGLIIAGAEDMVDTYNNTIVGSKSG